MRTIQIVLLTFLSLCFFACNNQSKKGDEQLVKATNAYKKGDYNAAKQMVDSIKKVDPANLEARMGGNSLMEQIVLAEQSSIISYLDSLLDAKQRELSTFKRHFVFEKDARYQDVGNYFWPSQTTERNFHRSFLRFQVSETGVMSMTSIYCGKGTIRHSAVRVTMPDGASATTPTTGNRFTSTNGGECTEKVDYRLGNDGGVIEFIRQNTMHNIQASYLGGSRCIVVMTAQDKIAAAQLYKLYKLLSGVNEMKRQLEQAKVKKTFVLKKMEYDSKHKEKKQK